MACVALRLLLEGHGDTNVELAGLAVGSGPLRSNRLWVAAFVAAALRACACWLCRLAQ
jgi:hypothetical protein